MKYFEVTARLPLPDNFLDSQPIESEAVKIAGKFRDEFMKYAEKSKIDGAVVEAAVKKTKPKGAPKSAPAAGGQNTTTGT